MMKTIDIEDYFLKNKKSLNLDNCISTIAWKNGSLVDCQGNEQAFRQNHDTIVRKGEYDYTVNKLKVQKTLKELVKEKIYNKKFT